VKIRFRFDSLDDFLNDFAGWFIDDFRVTDVEQIMAVSRDEENDSKDYPCSARASSGAPLWPVFPILAALFLLAALRARVRRLVQ
jgi:hypothetical protein